MAKYRLVDTYCGEFDVLKVVQADNPIEAQNKLKVAIAQRAWDTDNECWLEIQCYNAGEWTRVKVY